MSKHIHFGNTPHPGATMVRNAQMDSVRLLARQMHAGHAETCALPSVRITADVAHHDVAMAYAERCAQLFDELGNSVRDSFEGLDAAARNLSRFPSSANTDTMRGCYHGEPAICIGAGPSAQQHIQAIAAAVPYARIFVCDAMTGALRRAGITPDHVCTVERPPIMAQVHDPAPGWSVIAPITAASEGLAKYVNACWWLTGDDLTAWAMHGTEYKPQPAPMSSGTLTVMAAIHAGCNPVVLVGHDLTAAADGATHADGAAPLAHTLRDKLRNDAPQRQDARTIDPDGMPTTYLWQQMRNSLEEYLAWSNNGQTVYRVGNGLRITGAIDIDRLPVFIVPKGAPGPQPSGRNYNIFPRLICAAEAMRDMRVSAQEIARALGPRSAEMAAECLRISALCTSDSSRALASYLLQTLYNQAHLRMAMGRDFASVVHRLANTIWRHADVLTDGLDRLANDIKGISDDV